MKTRHTHAPQISRLLSVHRLRDGRRRWPVMAAAAVGLLVLGVDAAPAARIDCPGIPLGQCLKQVETAFGVTVRSNAAVTTAATQVGIETTDPVSAVKAAFEGVGDVAAAFEYNPAGKVVTATLLGNVGALLSPASAAVPSTIPTVVPAAVPSAAPVLATATVAQAASGSSPATPVLAETQTDDELGTTASDEDLINKSLAQARERSEDLDEVINSPQDTGPPVTRRYLRDVMAKEAAKPLDLDGSVLPESSAEKNITVRQLLEIQKGQDKDLPKRGEIIMEDGMIRAVASLQQLSGANQ